jgi:hypothetical protein
MITTFRAMQSSRFHPLRRWRQAAIIGLLVLLLSGCNALRLGYSNGSTLAWWWLDGYMDFSREQAPAVKGAIERWFDWHRSTQLAEYAKLLDEAATQVTEPTTAAAVCRWQEVLVERLEPALDKAVVLAADILPLLGEPQLKALEQRQARLNAERREEFLQPDPQERDKAAMERTVKRIEMVYGRLGDAQRRVISAGLAASPFDAEAWVADSERRRRDVLVTLRGLVADKPDAETRLRTLRALAARMNEPASDAARDRQARLREFNCAFAAQIHNATTPAQRLKARDNIRGWEADVRSLLLLMP